jgi:hypothetical protein
MVGAVFVGLILSIALLVLVDQTPDHDDLGERLDRIESQMVFNSCLLLFPPEERTISCVTECQSQDG